MPGPASSLSPVFGVDEDRALSIEATTIELWPRSSPHASSPPSIEDRRPARISPHERLTDSFREHHNLDLYKQMALQRRYAFKA